MRCLDLRFLCLVAVFAAACSQPVQGGAAAKPDVASDVADVLTFDAGLSDTDAPVGVDGDPGAVTDAMDDVAVDVAIDATAVELDAIADADAIDADAGPPACQDDQKQCPHAFSYTGDGSEASIELRGSFNGWKVGAPMLQAGQNWSVSANMPWQIDVQYKFRIVKTSGAEVWILDPSNPATSDDGKGNTNSLLAAQSCDPWTCAGPQTVCAIPAKADAFDWRDGVMYFVFVDRFANGDPANDAKNPNSGVKPIANWHGGDWAGVSQKIKDGWFTALGVNVLWLTVPMDNSDAAEPGADGNLYTAYHGYWPRDINKTDAHFGTMEELKALVATAHQHGIKIVLDYAMNHLHASSPVWLAHKNDGWFHGLQVNGQECVCGSGVCPWDGPSGVFCWFRNYLPDFDFNNADARKASIDNVIWWMKQSGADGLRLDAIKHVEDAWLTALRQRLLAEIEPEKQQHVWLVGETFTGDVGFIKSFVDPCAKLDGQFDFPLRAKLATVVLMRQGKMADLEGFLDTNDGVYGPDAIMSTFLGNHDLPRTIHLAQEAPLWTDPWASGADKAWSGQPGTVTDKSAYERFALGMTILMTNRGVPLIYYGDEVGMPGAGDPDNRRPMQWTGLGDGQTWLLARMQALGKARAKYPALRRGTRTTVTIGEDTWLYLLTAGTQQVYVAINRGDQPAQVTGLPAIALTDALTGEAVQGPEVTVPARGARVLPVP